ncbi:MAG: T9SS type A sorting domain-containing protein [Bacteroidia bacterium]
MRKLVVLLALAFVGISLSSKATHYHGADMQWEQYDKDSLKFVVTFYRDCGGFTNYTMKFWGVTNTLGKLYPHRAVSVQEITPLCKSTCSDCSGSGCSFKYGFEKVSLTYYVPLDYWKNGNADTVTFMCFQNGGRVSNGTNYSNTPGIYVYVELDISSKTLAPSPNWLEQPNMLTCNGSDIKKNLSGLISNSGYKTTYHLMTPKVQVPLFYPNSSELQYTGRFDYDKPLTFFGFPNNNLALPKGFHLDTATGVLQFRPIRNEIASIAVLVKIWDDKNNLVATTIRDFQAIVIKCANNDPPVVSGKACRTPSLDNLELLACAGEKLCFDLCIEDQNKKDTLTLERVGDTTFGTFTPYSSKSRLDSAKFCFTPNASDTGKTLNLTLKASDNVCPLPASYIETYRITVLPYDSVDLDIDVRRVDSCGTFEFIATENNNKPIYDIEWFLNDSIYLGYGEKVEDTITTNGDYTISAVHNGCEKQVFKKQFKVKGINPIRLRSIADTNLCHIQNFDIGMKAYGGKGHLIYKWILSNDISFNQGNADSQQVQLGLSPISRSTNYTIAYRVSDSVGCKVRKEFNLTVKAVTQSDIQSDLRFCLSTDTVIALNLNNDQSGWQGTGVVSDTFYSKDAQLGANTLVYLDQLGTTCLLDSAVIISNKNPKITFGRTFSICKEGNDTLLIASPAKGKWSGQGIDSVGNFSPANAVKGNNNLTYSVTDTNGCSSTENYQIEVLDYKPALSVTDTAETCLNGADIEMQASPSGGQWNGPGLSSSSDKITLEPKQFGEGTFEIIYSLRDSNQCSNADTAIAIINGLPKPDFDVDSIVFQNDTLELSNQTTEINNTNYTWIITGPQNKSETGFEPQIIMDSLGMHGITLIATDAKTGCTDTLASSDSVKVVLNTGLQLGQIEGLKVYPNPYSQELNFTNTTGQNLQYQIISQDGKVVFEQNSNQATTNINLSHLAKGVYTLKITGDGIVEVQQVVKE